jgi:DNA polymerase III delta subunit
MPARADDLLERIAAGARPSMTLVHGDLVLAEPAAEHVAAALAAAAGCTVETYRRPPSLAGLLQDLRTFSLFSSAKVLLAVDTAVLADRSVAADLIDEAATVLPLGEGETLTTREKASAALLLQALRLFEVDIAGEPEEVIAGLPDWAFEGGGAARRGRGGRGRGKRQVEELRAGLATLLSAALRDQVETTFQSDAVELADLLRSGLPAGHALVLAESRVAADHPIVRQLASRDAVWVVGEVSAERGSWVGLDLLAQELERETGAAISTDALEELARRTLRMASDRRSSGPSSSVDPDSSARFAAEYRKLAGLAEGRIDRKLVAQVVEDRGEEDVWQLLDAIAAGRGGEALGRLHRLLGAADDPMAARLSFFSLLASFCRQLTAIRGLLRLQGVPPGEANYNRFKTQLAPRLQADIAGGKNPIAGLHPFRLHRAYLAASRLPERFLAGLPDQVLATEVRLKGGSAEPDAALARFVAELSTATESPASRRNSAGASDSQR